MENPQQKEPFEDVRTGLNIVSHLINGYATAILPFIRKDFGIAFFGVNALVAMLVMILFGAVENADEMLRYLVVWIVFVTAHRLDANRNYRKGRIIHSRYFGDSWFAIKLAGRRKNKVVQLMIEPAICLVSGVLICPYSAGIGKFLIVGAFAVMMFNGMQRTYTEQRVRRMHDAHIEQQATAQIFRGNNDDF